MKNKGFTLIELLAVIVILAIIALIAVPIILNIINDARENGVKRSAEAYVDAVENSIVNENLKNPSQDFKPDYCSVKENKTTLNCSYGDNQSKDIEVKIDGTLPEEGDINFDENGKIQNGTLVYEEYIADIGNNGVIDNFSERHKSDIKWFAFSDNEDGTATLLGIITQEWTKSTNKNKYDIEIPSKAPNGKIITILGNGGFSNRNLTSIRIPNTVVEIGNSVFSNNQITSLVIPDSVTSIGIQTFAGNKITNLKLGNSLKTIDDIAFVGGQITSLIIPDSVTSIGNQTFAGNKITSLKLGQSLKTIGSAAFASNQITNLSIPANVTSIGDQTFASNQITSLELGQSLKTIGSAAFAGNQITSVIIPNSVETISSSAFSKTASSNPNLTKIVNKTGKEFDWGMILGGDSQSCITCTVNGVEITAE